MLIAYLSINKLLFGGNMKRLLAFIVIITFVMNLFSELNDPILAITTSNDQLIYDQDKGIIQSGDNIYLSLFRKTVEVENLTYSLVCIHSNNNGADFVESILEVFELNIDDGALLIDKKYATTIKLSDDDAIMIFYTDPVSSMTKVTVSNDNGTTFTDNDIKDLAGRSQFQIIKNSDDILFSAIEEDVQFKISKAVSPRYCGGFL